jgi:hypothetical protein
VRGIKLRDGRRASSTGDGATRSRARTQSEWIAHLHLEQTGSVALYCASATVAATGVLNRASFRGCREKCVGGRGKGLTRPWRSVGRRRPTNGPRCPSPRRASMTVATLAEPWSPPDLFGPRVLACSLRGLICTPLACRSLPRACSEGSSAAQRFTRLRLRRSRRFAFECAGKARRKGIGRGFRQFVKTQSALVQTTCSSYISPSFWPRRAWPRIVRVADHHRPSSLSSPPSAPVSQPSERPSRPANE